MKDEETDYVSSIKVKECLYAIYENNPAGFVTKNGTFLEMEKETAFF